MAGKININLDTSKENYIQAKCKQNDDITLIANIFENGQLKDLSTASININAKKSNNTFVIQSNDISKSGNTITANLIRDITRVPGTSLIEIQLVESGKQNTTFTFILGVESSVLEGSVESGNVVTIIEDLQKNVELAKQENAKTEQLITSGGAASKADLNNLQASPRNFFIGDGWQLNSVVGTTRTTISKYHIKYSMVNSNPWLTFSGGGGGLIILVKKDDYITFSIKVKSNIDFVIRLFPVGGTSGIDNITKEYKATNNNFITCSITVKAKTDNPAILAYGFDIRNSIEKNSEIEIKEWTITNSGVRVDWMPSPEDVQIQIDTWNAFKASGGNIGGDILLPKGRVMNDTAGIFLQGNGMVGLSSSSTDGKTVNFYTDLDAMALRTSQINAKKISIGTDVIPFKDVFVGDTLKQAIGYTKLTNGLILQWGVVDVYLENQAGKTVSVTLPISFSNDMLTPIANERDNNITSIGLFNVACSKENVGSLSITVQVLNGVARTGRVRVNWIAIGY